METDELILGDQAKALDARISSRISESDRTNIWKSVNNILNSFTKGNDTILALGATGGGAGITGDIVNDRGVAFFYNNTLNLEIFYN